MVRASASISESMMRKYSMDDMWCTVPISGVSLPRKAQEDGRHESQNMRDATCSLTESQSATKEQQTETKREGLRRSRSGTWKYGSKYFNCKNNSQHLISYLMHTELHVTKLLKTA